MMFLCLQSLKEKLLTILSEAMVACSVYSLAGTKTELYETALLNVDDVYTSHCAPGYKGYLMISRFALEDFAAHYIVEPDTDTAMAANVGEKVGQITSFTGRMSAAYADDRSTLSHDCKAQTSDYPPCSVSVLFKKTESAHSSSGSRSFLGIAKQEPTASLSTSRLSHKSDQAMDRSTTRTVCIPFFVRAENPVDWNVPYRNLEKCSIVSDER
ncbi:hypothetical protein K449DRAFT_1747 [Hypoxylon sp. EC38]|nr:hypothetical protein K449DRAFT_1747 [Hypoxylon sp. EC38]